MAQSTGKTTFAFDAPPDLAKEIEDEVERRGITKSEVLRDLTKRGVKDRSSDKRYARHCHGVALNMWVLAGVSFVLGLFLPTDVISFEMAITFTLVFMLIGSLFAVTGEHFNKGDF